MKMENRLTRSSIIIIDYPEAFFCNAVITCNAGRNLEGVPNNKRILIPQIQRINDMPSRYDQHMQRSDRSNIPYYDKVFILVYLAGRNLV
jgi:hypothetical protein